MKKQLAVSALACSLIAGVMAPAQFNFSSTAEAQTPKTKLAFFNPKDANDAITRLATDKNDDSLGEVQEYIKAAKLEVESSNQNISAQFISDANDIALPLEEVEKNSDLNKLARNALNTGKKVYIYGAGLTIEKFEKLLGLEKMTAEVYPANVDPKEYANQKKPALGFGNKEEIDVIGYTTDKNAPNQIFLGGIEVYPVNEVKPHMYLQAILENEISTQKAISQGLSGTQKSAAVSFFKPNVAKAASEQIRTFPSNTEYLYDSSTGVLKGRIYSDIILYQDLTEKDPTYDNFTVRDNVQINSYNGASTQGSLFDHDIPYDTDEIFDWKPGDTSSQSSWSVSIPWGISYSWSSSSSYPIDEQGDYALDYGRWVINSDPNNYYFQPSTAWNSLGTYAMVDIRNRTKFFWTGLPGGSSGVDLWQTLNIRYDYETSPGT